MIYRRKISHSEAENGYILVEKAKLKIFPPLGAKFALRFGEINFRACVTANPCKCVGTWHDHYHIEAADLKSFIAPAEGRNIVIAENDSSFEIKFD